MEPIVSMLDTVLECLIYLGIVICIARIVDHLATNHPELDQIDDWDDDEQFHWEMLWEKNPEDWDEE